MPVDLASVTDQANAVLDVAPDDLPGVIQALTTLHESRLVAAQVLIDYPIPTFAPGDGDVSWTAYKTQMLNGSDVGSVQSMYLRVKQYMEADDIPNTMESLGLLFKACNRNFAYLSV